jgi:hypothetical protein
MSNGPHNMSPDIFERAVIYAPSGQRDEGRRSVAGAYDNRDDGGAAKCLEGRRRRERRGERRTRSEAQKVSEGKQAFVQSSESEMRTQKRSSTSC